MKRRQLVKKTMALSMATAMLASSFSAMANAEETGWSEETTVDGWNRVIQKEGPELGYSLESGVTLIEKDGHVFKDLNKNGELDVYEDWREDSETRAKDAVSKMTLEEMAGLRVAILSMSVEGDGTSIVNMGDQETTLGDAIANGLRYVDNMAYIMGDDDTKKQVAWSNMVQTLSEGSGIGIPFMITADPSSSLVGYATEQIQASSFDTEAVNELWQDVAKGYRAKGVTMMLGPQVDLETDPRAQSATVWSEDPKLSADMTTAAIDGMQSTYDENGNDIGWGTDSVACMMKHFAANNAIEGGRSYHNEYGKYTVYPGDNYETQLIPYVDGGFYLDGKTEQTSAIMISYSIQWSEDDSLGEKKASALNEDVMNTARAEGFDGLIVTDAIGVHQYDYDGSFAQTDAAEQAKLMFEAGIDIILSGEFSRDSVMTAYNTMIEEMGEEEANKNFSEASYRAILPMFQLGLFENPYHTAEESLEMLDTLTYVGKTVNDVIQSGIVMVKNSGNVIAEDTSEEKETVYIPKVNQTTTSMRRDEQTGEFIAETVSEWVLLVDLEEAEKYFNIVTDTVLEDGSLQRATEEELAGCKKAIVMITNPDTGSGYDEESDTYYPISLQYSEYTADSDSVRKTSIAGDAVKIGTQTPYGIVESVEVENRSYYGNSTVAINLDHMELVQEVSERLPESAQMIVCLNSSGAMIFSEIEPYADAILMMFGRCMSGGSHMGAFTDASENNFLAIVAGKKEPTGLLPLQMPKDMETVEAQYEDTPRDMECYQDAEGNIYDFAFGMNWSGVIQDERTETYGVSPELHLTKTEYCK